MALDIQIPSGDQRLSEEQDELVRRCLRQLERRLATQRGEPTVGAPSRRLPKPSRSHPRSRGEDIAKRETGSSISA